MTPRDEVSLRQMLDHAAETQQFAAGRSRADLDADRLFNLAIARLLEIVGEAACRVSQPLRDQYPQIPWSQIIGLRNRLIHGYDQLDCDILWAIIQNDVPILIAELEPIVGEKE